MLFSSKIVSLRIQMLAVLIVPGSSIAQTVEYFDYALFLANSQSLTIENFELAKRFAILVYWTGISAIRALRANASTASDLSFIDGPQAVHCKR